MCHLDRGQMITRLSSGSRKYRRVFRVPRRAGNGVFDKMFDMILDSKTMPWEWRKRVLVSIFKSNGKRQSDDL